jgi:PKD repeat protein
MYESLVTMLFYWSKPRYFCIMKSCFGNLGLILLLISCETAFSQVNITNRGELIKISTGTTIYGVGDYNNLAPDPSRTDNPQLILEGTIAFAGNIVSNSVDFFDNSILLDLIKDGQGQLLATGSGNQFISGISSVNAYDLTLQKSGSLFLNRNISVTSTLNFVSGSLFLGNHTIDLGNAGLVVNETESNRIYGDGTATGQVLYTIPADPGSLSNVLGGLGLRIQGVIFGGGTSRIKRGHARQTTAGDGGIHRYYDLELGAGQEVNNLRFYYWDAEVVPTGINESDLVLYVSSDGGTTWTKLGGTIDMASNYVEINSITLTGNLRLTLASGSCAAPPMVDIGPPTLDFCDGSSLLLDAGNPGLRFLWSTTETTQQINVSSSGAFSVRVTDSKGCEGFDVITVTERPAPVTDFFMGISCQDNAVQFTNTSTIVDASALTYAWDFGDPLTTTDVSTSVNGTYTYTTPAIYNVQLTARSIFNCSTMVAKPVTIHPTPIADFSFTNACLGQVTSFNNLSSVPLPYGLTYAWDFDDATTSTDEDPVKSFTSASTYNVTLEVTSNAACEASVTKPVTVRHTPVAAFTVTDVCETIDIGINNQSTIASGSLMYSWDFGDATTANATEPLKSFTSDGSYTITLTATSTFGCSHTASQPITIYAAPQAQFSVNNDCQDQAFTFTNGSSSSQGALSYIWDFDDGTNSTVSAPVKSFSSHGTYAVLLTATTSLGCVDTYSQNVMVHPVPVSTFDFTNKCQNDNVLFLNQSTIANGSFTSQWDFDDGTQSTTTSPVKSFPVSGPYDIVLTITSDQGCQSSAIKELEVFALPVIDFGGPSISTCGTSYMLNAGNPGSTYAWSTTATTQQITATQNGLYSVTVTTPDNCSAYGQVTVTLQGDVLPDLGFDRSVCGQTTLDAGYPGSAYLWSTGETTRTISASSTGTYSVQVTDINGCIGNDMVVITVNPVPIVNLGSDVTVCANQAINLDAGNPGANYQWSDNSTNRFLTPVSSGNYSVNVTNSFGCVGTDAIDVTINPMPVNNLSASITVCDEVTLNAANPGSTYSWSVNSSNQSINVVTSGTYSVTVTTVNSCALVFSSNVTVNYSPTVELGADKNLCFGQSVTLDAGSEGNSYRWSTGPTSSTIRADRTGLYRVEVLRTNGCSTKDSVQVTIYPAIENDLKPLYQLCANEPRIVNAFSQQGVAYEWSNVQGPVSNYPSITVLTPGRWSVKTNDAIGCSRIDSVQVEVDQDPITARYLVASFVNVGDSVKFIQLSYPDPVRYGWDFADGIVSAASDPVHVYLRPGDFNSSLVVEDSSQCRDSRSKVITVRLLRTNPEEDESSVFIEILQSSVFPNPTVDKIFLDIELNKEAEITVFLYTLRGSIVESRTFSTLKNCEEFDVSNLGSGVYVLKVMVNNETRSTRFVKL